MFVDDNGNRVLYNFILLVVYCSCVQLVVFETIRIVIIFYAWHDDELV
jgi:hypothetical protein